MKKYIIFPINTLFLIFLILFVLQFSSCSFAPIKKLPTPIEYNVLRGDSVMIYWHFENADRVYIDSIETSFQAKDSVKILANNPKNIKVWAYKGNLDSLLDSKAIIINGESPNISQDKEHTQEFTTIQRGPIKIYKEYQEVRGMASDYLRGVIKSDLSIPTNLKITSINEEQNGNNLKVKIKFLLLDNFGNFINNDLLCDNKHLCELTYSCNKNKITLLTFEKCRKEYQEKRQIGNDLAIMIDNSVSNPDNLKIYSNIYKAVIDLAQNDRLQLIEFNHKAKELRPMQYISYDLDNIKNYKQSKSNGLNAMYKILYNTIANLPESKNNKATIVITYSNDNSSLIYKISDIIKLSKSKQSPVYIIAVGDAIQTFLLRNLCEKSGGKLYHIFENEINDISQIINEIYFSMNNYYEVEFSDNNYNFENINNSTYKNCNDFESIFTININGQKLSSHTSILSENIYDYSQFQALALFDEKSYNFESTYNEILEVLIQTLKDNPNHNIQLIGHSGDEGEETYNNYLSKLRAEAVKNYLFKKGVPSRQVTIKSMGYRKPIYYQAKLPWMENINRRVELKWINPEKLPYEIIAEVENDESTAINKCKEWSNRGYKVYFERIIENQKAQYQVKLWGYSTREDVESEIKKLAEKYKNIKFTID